MRRLAITSLVLALFVSCSFWHDDYPGRACNSNDDCFEASGESCDLDLRECVPGPDAEPADA